MPEDAYDTLPLPVADAFRNASLFDLKLVCKARATRISYLFGHNSVVSPDAREGYMFYDRCTIVSGPGPPGVP